MQRPQGRFMACGRQRGPGRAPAVRAPCSHALFGQLARLPHASTLPPRWSGCVIQAQPFGRDVVEDASAAELRHASAQHRAAGPDVEQIAVDALGFLPVDMVTGQNRHNLLDAPAGGLLSAQRIGVATEAATVRVIT